MNDNKSGRRWFLFWSLVAATLLAVPAISGWAGSAADRGRSTIRTFKPNRS